MRRRARRSPASCGRVTSSLARTFSAIKCPVAATRTRSCGSSSMSSASATISGSMPDEAKSRSMTGPAGSWYRVSLAVARRPTASCSTIASISYPAPRRVRMSASASVSPETATAISASRVNRGSVRADTASPPTSAKEWPVWARSAQIWRSAVSREVTRVARLHPLDDPGSRPIQLRVAPAASRPAVVRFLRPGPRGDGAEDFVA
jgi:hypothetical protein